MTTISLRKGSTRLPPEVNRVLYVLYYRQAKMSKKFDQKKEDEIAKMQEKYGVSTKDK